MVILSLNSAFLKEAKFFFFYVTENMIHFELKKTAESIRT